MLTREQLIKEIKTGLTGYKQSYVSDKSGVDVAVISRLLAGKISKPEYDTLYALYQFIVHDKSDRVLNNHVIDLRGE